MCVACWIPKATHTHSRYVFLSYCNSGYMNMPQYCVTLYIHCLSCLKIMSSFGASRHADFPNLLLHVCFSLCGSAWKKDIHRNHFLVRSQCLSRPLNMCVQCRLLHLSLTCYKKRKTAEDRVSTSLTLRQIWGGRKMKLHMSVRIRCRLVVLGNLPLWQELLLLIGWAAGHWLW